MEYRKLPHGDEKISVLGLGMGGIQDKAHRLSVKADACLQCGHCNSRCPFKVEQQERMTEIAEYFG